MTQRPDTLKGIGLVLLAMAILPFIDVCAKFLAREDVPVWQLVWGRFFFGALLTLPFAVKAAGWAALRPVNPVFNSARAACLIIGTACFFQALEYLPIADTLAIYFIQPILITALSPLLLRETVDLRRWLTVFAGFVGVLIIIRPGFQQLNPGVIFALGAGLTSAFYIIITRHLTGKADAMVTTFQTSAMGALVVSIAAPLYWQPPTGAQWSMIMLLGLIAICGHYLIARAYDFAEASLLSPFNYAEMIMAVAAGWYFFDDFPDRYTFLGVSILIACAIYISMCERARHSEGQKQTT